MKTLPEHHRRVRGWGALFSRGSAKAVVSFGTQITLMNFPNGLPQYCAQPVGCKWYYCRFVVSYLLQMFWDILALPYASDTRAKQLVCWASSPHVS